MIYKLRNFLSLLINLKTFLNIKKEWIFISESNDWSIYNDGLELIKFFKLNNRKARISLQPHLIFNSIIHFGSLNIFYSKFNSLLFKNNKIIVTFFHGYLGMNCEMDLRINFLLSNIDSVDSLIVSNTIMYNRMIKLGVTKNKLVKIPIPIDEEVYSFNSKSNISRKSIGLKKEVFTIGSFQKDGNGWDCGYEPKLVKGPDILCDVLESLNKRIDIQVLLIGPSRGYVKKRLKKNNINYVHFFLENADEVSNYYSLIDLYLVTSREEGGPKALLESVASNVPILTSKVGMATDLFAESENIIIDNDKEDYVKKSMRLKSDNSYKKILLKNYKTILNKNNWNTLIECYIKLLNKHE